MKIVVRKGIDIPIEGNPKGPPQILPTPKQISLNLDPFDITRFKVLIKVGDSVKIGQPLVENKSIEGQTFVAPSGGIVKEIRRGLKRRLLDIVIDVAAKEAYEEYGTHVRSSREELLALFMRSGIFPHIRVRPFDLIANPKFSPRSIFVKAIESLPFVPPAEMQVEGHETYFQAGLNALAKLTQGTVHLVYREDSSCVAFTEAQGVEKHIVSGPHPASSSSLHIHKIDPIKKANECVWTLSAIGVLTVGKMVLEGRYFTERILSVAGGGIEEGKHVFLRARLGFPVSELVAGRISNQLLRFISGDPLTGTQVEMQDFICYYHTALTVLPENTKREAFHFLRAGFNKYTATRTYVTGLRSSFEKDFAFTTSQHGEERAFIDGDVYARVMPMRIPTMQLVKAVMAEDFELAESLGLLEVTGEDFALASFICPSKIEMIQIIKEGLYRYSKEMSL